jgi:transposase
MHLSYSVSSYKGKSYKSYAIAESYRDGNTVRKRILWKIGKLSDEQARKIRLICQAAQDEEQLFTHLDHIVVKETRSYLDIAVVNELWKRLQLDDAFTREVTLSALPTQTVARILTINRCLDPRSHYSIPQWAKAHALKEVLDLDLSGLNDDKLYYELDKIFVNQTAIEDHIFKLTYHQAPESYRFVDYDLTTSYFVGHRCELSAFGKGKIECHGRRQVLLGVLINQQGYPFKWDVFPGNTAEVKTLKQNIDACKQRFQLNDQNVTLVFDRGIISAENAEEVESAGLKYISALDNNQIPAGGVDLKPFAGLPADIDTDDATDVSVPVPKGFKPYDDTLYYRDGSVIGSKRHIVGFNPGLFKDERRLRQLKLKLFAEFLAAENQKLKTAQKSRKSSATRGRIIDELNRLKIRKYFHEPVLHDIILEKKLKDGTSRSITSFQVEIEQKSDVIATEKLTDGVCVFITNHVERKGRGFRTPARTIIKAYRDKTKVEDVFKNVKSFLKLRPFFVNTTMHVKAVYTVCILAYFINRYLANLRKELGEKDFLNSRELYAPFRHIDIALLEDSRNQQTTVKAVQLPEETSNLIERLQMGHILWQNRKTAV